MAHNIYRVTSYITGVARNNTDIVIVSDTQVVTSFMPCGHDHMDSPACGTGLIITPSRQYSRAQVLVPVLCYMLRVLELAARRKRATISP